MPRKTTEWFQINPTLIDHEFTRYEIVDTVFAGMMPIKYEVRIKKPNKEMEELGCDSCAGPHQPQNRQCAGNRRTTPFIARCRVDPDSGGVILFNLITRAQLPGVWIVQGDTQRRLYGSGTLELML